MMSLPAFKNNPSQFEMAQNVMDLGVRGIYLMITGLSNDRQDNAHHPLLEEAERQFLATHTEETAKSSPALTGFRELHRKIGVNSNKAVPASENLVKLLLKRGSIPRINPVVDLYNLVSIKTGLALGAHDIKRVSFPIALRFTDGTENFHPIGATEAEKVKSGEYAYIDANNDILCRLEVRQVEKTKVTPQTTECFYIIQGNQNTDAELLEQTAEELTSLTKKFCGGTETTLFKHY